MTIDLIIQNFQNSSKIEKILFAKEIKQRELYDIIDLKEYLDIANITFILTSFQKNYTVANHIKSDSYKKLMDKLNNFSKDIMALNLNNLFQKSSKELIKELNKIDNISIKNQAQILKQHIKKLTDFEAKKRYQTYFNLSKDLFEKNYILLSLALLNESIRLYIKTTIKKSHKSFVEKIEEFYKDNLYDIGDFFIKLGNKKFTFDEFQRYVKSKNRKDFVPITSEEFQKLKESFPEKLLKKCKHRILDHKQNLIKAISYARNNLAHGNINYNFSDIQKSVGELLEEYSKYI